MPPINKLHLLPSESKKKKTEITTTQRLCVLQFKGFIMAAIRKNGKKILIRIIILMQSESQQHIKVTK